LSIKKITLLLVSIAFCFAYTPPAILADDFDSRVVAVDVLNSGPIFSHESGFYDEQFELEILTKQENAEVYFTLDASEPAPIPGKKKYSFKNSYPVNPGDSPGRVISRAKQTFKYSKPIKIQIQNQVMAGDSIASINTQTSQSIRPPQGEVTQGVVVRARLFIEGRASGPTVTRIFFKIPKKAHYNVPVLSLVMPEESLFGYENGIYVAGRIFDKWRSENPDAERKPWKKLANYTQRGPEWERSADLQYFTADNEKVLDQVVGVRIHGGTTRGAARKSLRIYARDEYGEDTLDYQFFQSRNVHTFKRLILRNSGNDHGNTLFRDAMMQSLVENLALDKQAYQPVVLFVNGTYWGIHNARDRLDRYYLHYRHGVDAENLDIVRHQVNRSSEDILRFMMDFSEGNSEHYLQMMEYIKTNAIEDPHVYQEVSTLMDISNFMDYQISQVFFGNTDWPHNNLAIWRLRTEAYEKDAPYGHDGRWRWMLFDTDHGFGYRGSSSRDSFARAIRSRAPLDSTFLLRNFLRNESFRHKFINNFADFLNTIFSPDVVIERINQMQKTLAPLMDDHIARWGQPSSLQQWEENVELMIDFARERPGYVRQHIIQNLDLKGEARILINISGRGGVRINTVELNALDEPWSGVYFKGVPVEIEAKPAWGYRFSRWDGLSEKHLPLEIVLLDENTNITAVFTREIWFVFLLCAAPGLLFILLLLGIWKFRSRSRHLLSS